MKLWDKDIETRDLIIEFTAGMDSILDLQIASDDVVASMAHVIMLAESGLIGSGEKKKLLGGLLDIHEDIEQGKFTIPEGTEDVHSQVEILLTGKLGNTGKKLHTARSRNDQVITDLKLFYRSTLVSIVGDVKDLAIKLIAMSDKYRDVELPGYTHFQVAMPSSFGLWFAAYAESLAEDLQVLGGTFRYMNQNPLGSAAGYGTSFPINRDLTTELLEFEDLHINSVNAQLARGKSEKILMAGISCVAGSISKLAMDMVLYMNQNFNFIQLREEFTTGSSIMPHKKNPDVLELIRAKANRIQAREFEVMSVTNNLPSGYHRDYQLLKEICFPALADLKAILSLMSLLLDNIEINRAITGDDIYKYLGTVDAMNRKVMDGMSYRDAYREVADEIKSGKYKAGERFQHTHTGSIGNPGNERILEKLEKEYRFFQPERYGDFNSRFIRKIKKEHYA